MFSTPREAEKFLFSRRAAGMKLGLENIRNLARRMGDPQNSFPAVHIAGTNGKGSTAAMLEAVLSAAGYKTGIYTSPHLVDMRERIRINGEWITEVALLNFLNSNHTLIEETHVTFFEILTMLAFDYFKRSEVEIAVLETGLGGRLDATSIASPVLTMITDIHLDHTRILGNRLGEIAFEKAGILKAGIPCIARARVPSVRRILSEEASKKGAPITFVENLFSLSRIRLSGKGSTLSLRTRKGFYSDLFISLAGRHQIRNAVMAVLAAEALNDAGWHISTRDLRNGLARVQWPARLQLLDSTPRILLDSAHNPAGMQTLKKALQTIYSYRRLILVLGILEDKEYDKMTATIAPLADRIILTRPVSDRALDPAKLASRPSLAGSNPEVEPDIHAAILKAIAKAGPEDLILCAGSIFLVGEVLKFWNAGRYAHSPWKDQ